MDAIDARLIVGGDLGYDDDEMRANLDGLVAAGITHIIDCREEWSDEGFVAEHAPHITYLQAPHDDNGFRASKGWFDLGVDFAMDAFENAGAKVYIHCHMGV